MLGEGRQLQAGDVDRRDANERVQGGRHVHHDVLHVEAMAEELTELDVGSELSQSAVETRTYAVAAKHLCRSSCIVPAATLKVMEVTAGAFRPEACAIEFLQDAI